VYVGVYIVELDMTELCYVANFNGGRSQDRTVGLLLVRLTSLPNYLIF
jgi:hypothetical protein